MKITISLSKRSVDFLKSEASKHHTHYGQMIQKLIDEYVEAHQKD